MAYNHKNDRYNHKNTKSHFNNKDKTYYIGAPYNFVPFYAGDVFCRYEEGFCKLPSHNSIDRSPDGEKLYSGEITYTFKNHTPIFVSNGETDDNKVDFYKNFKGKYAVPASTMRGLIRSNMAILGLCAVGSDIEDKTFMYRQIGGKKSEIKERYEAIVGVENNNNKTKVKNVKAGYIEKKGKGYYIYDALAPTQTNSETNFYIVKETYVQKEENKDRFSYITDRLMYTEDNFVKFKPKHIRNFSPKVDYKPYYEAISYSTKGGEVIAIDAPNKLEHQGYVVSTGKINDEKKSFYVIPAINKEKVYSVDKKAVTAFKDDFKAKKTQLKKSVKINDMYYVIDNTEFYSLPENDNVYKPVFYINEGKEFGFTPMLRIFYANSVHKGLSETQKENKLDYVSAMFGFIGEKQAYKSRLYFEDAVTDCSKTMDLVRYNLGGPKASSYFDYLNDGKSYNDNFTLRGIKQYWFREIIEEPGKIKNKKVAAKIKAIESNKIFTGKIKFKNLHRDELGLLLWCLKLEKDCQLNIGMAKSKGFGRIKFNEIKLSLYDREKMYGLDNINFDLFKSENESIDDYINYYKAYINGKAKIQDITAVNSISIFLRMKKEFPSVDRIRYMDINKSEYQSRTVALPTAEGVLDEKDYHAYIKEQFSTKN